MGDSILKHIRGYKLLTKVGNCNVYKSYSGAKVTCIRVLQKTNTEKNAHHIIMHVGTNDITTKKAAEQMTENIANLAIKLKRNCDVSISGIIERNDQHQKKAADVNQELKELKVLRKKLQFLDHGNTITVRYLHASNLHLNMTGTQVLSNMFPEAISNITK